ncbi:MAG: hypothetical protein HYS22_00285 [Deltaproteobacteria bacterium]|nr:hypothetical protein [Deltaproteobacteria bacterium]
MKGKIGLLGVSGLFLAVLFFTSGGCGSSSSSSDDSVDTISGTASFLNGATPATGSAGALTGVTLGQAAVTPSDGNWLLSPDKMILTLTSIGLVTSSGSNSGALSNTTCTITYDRSQVGLAKLVDCPFTVDPGTYASIILYFDATYQILISDSTNGFYTTSSGITTGASPSGGAQNLTVTTTSSGSTFGNTSYLASPLTIAKGDTVTLSIVISGLQFFRVNVSGGTVGLGSSGSSDPFRPDMTASVTAPASLGFYVAPKIGTALSYNSSTAGATGITSVSTYFSSATTPTFLVLGLNGTPDSCSPIGVSGAINGPPNDNTLGGYLGLDSNGVLGWAVPTDNKWTTYAAEFSMPQLTVLNQTTQLKCKKISTDPAPSGNTFASGAPNITSADYSTDMMLVAK